MANKPGRFTPKKTAATRSADAKVAAGGVNTTMAGKAPAYAQSGRYTPPTAHPEELPSPKWVPIVMGSLLILGLLSIVLNYMSVLPGATSNWYLIAGIGLIAGGFVTATQLR